MSLAMLSANAQLSTQVGITPIVADSQQPSITFDNGMCNTMFTVDVPQSGDYHIRFWINPVKTNCGTFQTYKVKINGEEVGNIMPMTSDWQSIGMTTDESIYFSAGENEISIVGDAIAAPMVDMVRLATVESQSEISQTTQIETMQISEPEQASTLETVTLFPAGATAVKAAYSFNNRFNFRKGQIIEITTTSDNLHGIDMFLYREGDTTVNLKAKDLNWYAGSQQYSSTSDRHRAVLQLKSPLSALYIVKLRGGESGKTAVVDSLTICVKDSVNATDSTLYTYANCSAYSNHLAINIPANSNYDVYLGYHSRQVVGSNLVISGCVEGDASEPGRVVEYISPGGSTAESVHSTTRTVNYAIKATGFHVYSSNSLQTEATCYVLVSPSVQATEQRRYEPETAEIETVGNGDISIGVETGNIILRNKSPKLETEVYNMNGMLVYRGFDDAIAVSAKGIYVVRVDGKTYKVAVR